MLEVRRWPRLLASAVFLLSGCDRTRPGADSPRNAAALSEPADEAVASGSEGVHCEGLPLCRDVPSHPEPCCDSGRAHLRRRPVQEPPVPLFAAGVQAGAEVEYRIPVLVQAGDALVAFAEERYAGGGDNGLVKVVYRGRPRAGADWGPKRTLCEPDCDPADPACFVTCGNPTPVYDARTGELHVLMAKNVRFEVPRDSVPGDRPLYYARGVWQADALVFGAPVPLAAPHRLVVPADYGWDAVGPGAGTQLSDGRLAFPALGRVIFATRSGSGQATGDVDDLDWSYETIDASFMGDPARFAETTLLTRNDGTLYRTARVTGPHRYAVFRRAFSIGDASESCGKSFCWSDYEVTGQPITPSHGCAGCHHWATVCPSACCSAAELAGSGRKLCHAAVTRWDFGESDRLAFTNPGTSRNRRGLAVRLSFDEGLSWPIGRQLLPADQATGYTAVVSTDGPEPNGLGVLYEHYVNGQHSLEYGWFDTAWVLCGRTQPIYVGANPWFGSFDYAIRTPGPGGSTYVGTAGDGKAVRVTTGVSELTTGTVTVALEWGRAGDSAYYSGGASVSDRQPGVYTTRDGRTLVVPGWRAAGASCDVGFQELPLASQRSCLDRSGAREVEPE